MTCSCQDWIKRRSEYSALDIRRCCKHLSQALIEIRGAIYDPFLWHLLARGGVPHRLFVRTYPVENKILICDLGEDDNILVLHRGKRRTDGATLSGELHLTYFEKATLSWKKNRRPANSEILKASIYSTGLLPHMFGKD